MHQSDLSHSCLEKYYEHAKRRPTENLFSRNTLIHEHTKLRTDPWITSIRKPARRASPFRLLSMACPATPRADVASFFPWAPPHVRNAIPEHTLLAEATSSLTGRRFRKAWRLSADFSLMRTSKFTRISQQNSESECSDRKTKQKKVILRISHATKCCM